MPYNHLTDNAKIKNKAKPPSAIKRNKERALKHREMKFQQLETKITSNKSTQTAKHCKNATTKFWQRLIICRTRDIDQGDDSNETESKITKATQLEPAIPDNHLLKEPVNTFDTMWKPRQIGSKTLTFEMIVEKKILKIEDMSGNEVYLGWESVSEVWSLESVLRYRLSYSSSSNFNTSMRT
ncbi:hypothetical protein FQA39_LY18297 [Lamprigera yunnana]|nr:hypothetical protein FQA39_LY18297 [Lamprigera yunnana]